MSTSGDVQYIGGYHEYIGGFQYKSKAFMNLLPHMNHDTPDVLKISPQCNEHTLYRVKIISITS